MTRGWRWETEQEYAGRVAEHPEGGFGVELKPPEIFKASYDAHRRRLCKVCGGPVGMLPCPFHRAPKRPSDRNVVVHLVCRDCGRCVDDLAP